MPYFKDHSPKTRKRHQAATIKILHNPLRILTRQSSITRRRIYLCTDALSRALVRDGADTRRGIGGFDDELHDVVFGDGEGEVYLAYGIPFIPCPIALADLAVEENFHTPVYAGLEDGRVVGEAVDADPCCASPGPWAGDGRGGDGSCEGARRLC